MKEVELAKLTYKAGDITNALKIYIEPLQMLNLSILILQLSPQNILVSLSKHIEPGYIIQATESTFVPSLT